MKSIKLTQGKYATVDEMDFEKFGKLKWHYKEGYAVRHFAGKGKVRLHRLILDAKDGQMVDHINRDTLDNRRGNLRICSVSENTRNMGIKTNNKSGYKGVSYDKERNKWASFIRYGNKGHNLGRFNTKEDAARAYDKEAERVFGNFACTNASMV